MGRAAPTLTHGSGIGHSSGFFSSCFAQRLGSSERPAMLVVSSDLIGMLQLSRTWLGIGLRACRSSDVPNDFPIEVHQHIRVWCRRRSSASSVVLLPVSRFQCSIWRQTCSKEHIQVSGCTNMRTAVAGSRHAPSLETLNFVASVCICMLELHSTKSKEQGVWVHSTGTRSAEFTGPSPGARTCAENP